MTGLAQPELFVDGASTAETRIGMIRLEIPSGQSVSSFALTPHAAARLCEALRRAVVAQHADDGATVVPFPAKAKRRKGKA